MTEERFGQIIENTIEGAAQKFDASLERQWKKHKVVRVITKTLSYVVCLGLALGAFELKARGYGAVAKICLIIGIVGIITNIIMAYVFRKR